MTGVVRRPLAAALLAGGFGLLAIPGAATAAGAGSTANTYKEYKVDLTGGASGEPSIGWSPKQKAALYGAATSIARLTWDDSKPDSPMTNKDVTPTLGTITTADTIVTVDPYVSRTFFAELAAVGSLLWYSDDAGDSWTESTGFSPLVLLDHESVGAGPFTANALPHLGTDAVYYCAQNGYSGACGVSYDGGLTFAPGSEVDNTPLNDQGDSDSTLATEGGACSALHGHLKVGPDGTAYLPLKGCGGALTFTNLTNTEFEGGNPSVSVSEDNGQTWTVRRNPNGNNTDESDNAVSVGPKNTLYMSWEDGRNLSDTESAHTTAAKVSISLDKGRTWIRTADLTPPGIHNVMFPVVTSGDDDRAAVAFLGTSGIGDDQQNGFKGMWDLFVATTYDQGRTWTTVDATAGDPVHRGCVDNQGLAPGSPKNNVCANRNMLDFNDISVDSTGRVLVAYTKTCTSHDCITAPPDADSDSTKLSDDTQNYVLRQSGGKGLYAANDGTLGTTTSPSAPTPSASASATPTPPAPLAPASLPNTSAARGWAGPMGVAGGVLVAAAPLLRRGARRRRTERRKD